MERTQTERGAWWMLAVISIPVFIGSLDLTVVSAFLPQLINELNIDLVSIDSTAWVVTAYLLAYTISLTFMGRVSDLIGRRWAYAICLIIYIVGSILVAVAHQWPTDVLNDFYRRNGIRLLTGEVTLHVIIAARVVQAIGAGALVPVSLALVGDLFPAGKRALPLGLMGSIDTLGWMLGTLYGGLFIQIMPWQGLFWMNVPLTLFALVVTLWGLRHAPSYRVKGGFDFLGLALIIGALTALNIGLGGSIDIGGMSSFEDMSSIPPYAGELLLMSAAFFAVFVFTQFVSIRQMVFNLFRKTRQSIRKVDPLIDLRLFGRRNIGFGSVTNFFIGYALFIGLVSVPLLVNVRLESSAQLNQAALEVGLLLSGLTIPMALATIPGGYLSGRIGYRNAIFIGLSIAAVGFLTIWLTWHIDISAPLIMAEMAVIGVGIGLTFAPVSASVINAAKDGERGVASALVLVMRLLGMTISVSSLTTYALNRVAVIAGERGVMIDTLIDAAPQITVEVLGEFGLIGVAFCLLAMIPAAFIRDDGDAQPESVNPSPAG